MELLPFDHSGFYPFDYGGAGNLCPGSGVVLLVFSGPLTRGPVVHGALYQ